MGFFNYEYETCDSIIESSGHSRRVAKDIVQKAGSEGIRYLREELLNYTRRQFADELLVDQCTVRRWEKGIQKPSEQSLESIANEFYTIITKDDFFLDYLSYEKWHAH